MTGYDAALPPLSPDGRQQTETGHPVIAGKRPIGQIRRIDLKWRAGNMAPKLLQNATSEQMNMQVLRSGAERLNQS